jgi:hypothetical protein
VWQKGQPTVLNKAFPLEIDAAPPGSVVEGAGGASKHMQDANFSIARRFSDHSSLAKRSNSRKAVKM